MPKRQTIPAEIQEEVQKLIDEFNNNELKESTSLLSAFFPGEEFVDGTVTGAMKAGMVAYEIR